MRDALEDGASEAFRSLPLIELAKQRYRDVLRNQPADWDARYNLSRALQLAPEIEQETRKKEEPPKKEQSVSTLQGARSTCHEVAAPGGGQRLARHRARAGAAVGCARHATPSICRTTPTITCWSSTSARA